jgi:flagellar motor switch protein FliM
LRGRACTRAAHTIFHLFSHPAWSAPRPPLRRIVPLMSEDTLSPEELAGLLHGLSTGHSHSTPVQVRSFDIGHEPPLLRERLPGLELVNDRFARQLRVQLSGFCGRDLQIAGNAPRMLRYSEFLGGLAAPATLHLVRPAPLAGVMLVVFEDALVLRAVDQLFGGDGRGRIADSARVPTPVETRVARRLLDVVLDAYRQAWEPVIELTCEYVRSETNPQLVSIGTPDQVTLVTTLSVGEPGAKVHVCMPYAMLEPARSVLEAAASPAARPAERPWLGALTEQVRDAEVELSAQLATATLTLREVMSLQPGDVVAIDLEHEIPAHVDGVPLLRCRYGVVNRHYAIKVERVASGEPAQG